MVIVDTLHRSAPGTEENSATEFGLIFEATAGIRDEYATTTLFTDHTGHGGGRLCGTSANARFRLIFPMRLPCCAGHAMLLPVARQREDLEVVPSTSVG